MKANGHKLEIRKYHLKIRRNFLIVKVVKPKNKLPKQMVDPPSLEALKTWPWDNSYSWPFLEQMFALDNLQRFLLNSYLPSFTLIEKYCVEKVLEWFLNPWIQFCACILLSNICYQKQQQWWAVAGYRLYLQDSAPHKLKKFTSNKSVPSIKGCGLFFNWA